MDNFMRNCQRVYEFFFNYNSVQETCDMFELNPKVRKCEFMELCPRVCKLFGSNLDKGGGNAIFMKDALEIVSCLGQNNIAKNR